MEPRQFTAEREVVEIAEGFLARTLPADRWTHEAHFAATLYLLLRRPDVELSRDLPGLIAGYNVSQGGENTDTSGYHETLTQYYVRAITAFAAAWDSPRDLLAMTNALVRSEWAHRETTLRYWDRATIMSIAARRGWVEPDVAPLPF